MAYTPSSFNYSPRPAPDFNQGQFQDFAKWIAEQGIDMFNLARADRNTQLEIANRFQQQQADRAYRQQQYQNRLGESERRFAEASQVPQMFSQVQAGLAAAQPKFRKVVVPNVTGPGYESYEPTEAFLQQVGGQFGGYGIAGRGKG